MKNRGFSIIEAVSVLFLLSIVLWVVVSLFTNNIQRTAARLSMENSYVLHVEPIQRLFKVAQAFRYSVYSTLVDMQTGNRAMAVATGQYARFERNDNPTGQWFGLWYDSNTSKLMLGPGVANSTAFSWTAPLSSSFISANFDCSGGYLALFCTQQVFMPFNNITSGNAIRYRTQGGMSVVDYLIQMEPVHD